MECSSSKTDALSLTLILQNPVQAYGLAFIFSITGYLGITFVLTLVRAFGALLAVTGTILMSSCYILV